MTGKITYSVIVPVYNGEATLERCLDSLVSQRRQDIEIIVVNDGSRDRSEEIALAYMEKYDTVWYFRQDNAGVSRARNAGLDAAKGRYITFVDSDDYVTADYFAVLDEAGKSEDWDLLVFANQTVGGTKTDESALFAALEQKKTAAQKLELLLCSRKIMPPWNKRFKRSIIEENHLRFIEGMQIGEDFNFCLAYAVRCGTVGVISRELCCIDVSGEGSLSRKYRPDLDRQMAAVFHHAARTMERSTVDDACKARLMGTLDYLFVKNAFTCVAEEFKSRELHYMRDRKEITQICTMFRKPLADRRCGMVHKCLRVLLKWKMYFPIYMVAYLVKGRKYRAQAKR